MEVRRLLTLLVSVIGGEFSLFNDENFNDRS